jgi:hypothetical protein
VKEIQSLHHSIEILQNVMMEILKHLHLLLPLKLQLHLAIAGSLSFNPITDELENEKGEKVKLDAPSGEELPPRGFDEGKSRICCSC